MKTDQIERAVNLAERLSQAVRDAHSDACQDVSENPQEAIAVAALELLLMDLIEPAANLLSRLRRIELVTMPEDEQLDPALRRNRKKAREMFEMFNAVAPRPKSKRKAKR